MGLAVDAPAPARLRRPHNPQDPHNRDPRHNPPSPHVLAAGQPILKPLLRCRKWPPASGLRRMAATPLHHGCPTCLQFAWIDSNSAEPSRQDSGGSWRLNRPRDRAGVKIAKRDTTPTTGSGRALLAWPGRKTGALPRPFTRQRLATWPPYSRHWPPNPQAALPPWSWPLAGS